LFHALACCLPKEYCAGTSFHVTACAPDAAQNSFVAEQRHVLFRFILRANLPQFLGDRIRIEFGDGVGPESPAPRDEAPDGAPSINGSSKRALKKCYMLELPWASVVSQMTARGGDRLVF